MLKNASCVPYTAIDIPFKSNEYAGWTNIVDALGLMNLFEMAPLVLPLALSTVVSNDISKVSMINASGGGSLPISLYCALGEQILVPASSLVEPLMF